MEIILIENSTLGCLYKNMKSRVSFRLRPKFTGRYLYGFKGKATSFSAGHCETVVVKKFPCSDGTSARCYMACTQKATELTRSFNKLMQHQFGTMKSHVSFVHAALTVMDDRAILTRYFYKIAFTKDENVIFEERLRGDFKVFNDISKRGKNVSDTSRILDAFCHYTYHKSVGHFVICGLKGVQDKQSGRFILTNPTIHSRNQVYGYKDTGSAGINNFFCNHVCNNICDKFLKPEPFPAEFVLKSIDSSLADGTKTSPVLPSLPLQASAPPITDGTSLRVFDKL